MGKFLLGKLKMRILKILWKKKRVTARDICDEIKKDEMVALNYVQTLLRGLEKSGIVDHDIENRAHVYFPIVGEERIVGNAVREFVDNIFFGSAMNMFATIVKNEYIPPDEIDEIIDIIDSKE